MERDEAGLGHRASEESYTAEARTDNDGPHSGAHAGDPGDDRGERARLDPGSIRAEDTEPYIGLQYVARLFKLAAMVVIVAAVAEIVAGIVVFSTEGFGGEPLGMMGGILNLLVIVVRGVVLAAILWGASDLTLLFIDVGHDVRAQRVLLGRVSARARADMTAAGREARGIRDG